MVLVNATYVPAKSSFLIPVVFNTSLIQLYTYIRYISVFQEMFSLIWKMEVLHKTWKTKDMCCEPNVNLKAIHSTLWYQPTTEW